MNDIQAPERSITDESAESERPMTIPESRRVKSVRYFFVTVIYPILPVAQHISLFLMPERPQHYTSENRSPVISIHADLPLSISLCRQLPYRRCRKGIPSRYVYKNVTTNIIPQSRLN
ncbi:MAG: hypothetical protein LBT46_13895 [Planctomycetaceae bacterium]|jgi:hypothetical protein|nr:hypothetical protein [Planctomycetaceae bacterium]